MKVVIVGAGIVGASLAFQLSKRPHVEVVIIDQASPGGGATGHSFAWTNAFNKQPRHYHDLNRRSMDLWHSFVAELDAREALSTGGNLVLETDSDRAEALAQQVAQLQSWGYPCRLIGAGELAALEPVLAGHRFAAACYLPREAHVDAPAVVQACLQRANTRGATVLEDTGPVALAVAQGGRSVTVLSSAGPMSADVVVLAAGTQTPTLAAQAGAVIPQEVSPGIVIRTGPRPRLLQSVALVHLPAIDERRREVHLRQLPDGTLQMGQGTQESLDRDDSQAHADDLLARAAHYFPAVANAQAIPQPVGYRPMPADGLPVIGFAAAGLYVAMMHSGVTLAPLVGELAAIEIAEGARVDLLAPFRPQRFAL